MDRLMVQIFRRFDARAASLLTIVACAVIAAGCSDTQYTYPQKIPGTNEYEQNASNKKRDSVFGPDGLNLFGSSKREDTGGGGIGVNSFLWRASLDSIAFMPLA